MVERLIPNQKVVGSSPTRGFLWGVAKPGKAVDFGSIIVGSNPTTPMFCVKKKWEY